MTHENQVEIHVMNFLLHSKKKKRGNISNYYAKKPIYLNSGNFKTPDCATFHMGDIILFAILFPKDIFPHSIKLSH